MTFRAFVSWMAFAGGLEIALSCPAPADSLPAPVTLSSGWKLQDVVKIGNGTGTAISQPGFRTTGWYEATVPGTVLTSLVNDGVYPEPLYGENNRPDKIPESLCRTSYWYRTTFRVPPSYAGHQIWLNFEGINYHAEIWVNGKNEGAVTGAFARGIFNISPDAKAGEELTLAVLVSPQPHPGNPIEQTIAAGVGPNGGITALDGPTFLCTIGWDWIPGIRDRDTGIWQKVFLSATGPVLIKEPLITTDLPLPSLDSTDIKIQAKLENTSDQPEKGVLEGTFGTMVFAQTVELAPHATEEVSLDPATTPQLHLLHPRLWWPNGYGPQNLYPVHLEFKANGGVSDAADLSIGVRKITYSVPGTDNLTVSVNGVPVMCKGGDWGMDEAMKRIPRERLEAEIRMHQMANYTIIRNWVGQSTSEDLYELCDKYGILLWDEFFQPNPSDGPNAADLDIYLINAREKIVRFRNHASIAIWCGRNEGFPPENINDELKKLMAELEPTRLYQPSSTSGHGVHSSGPYFWRAPREFYNWGEAFKTETGSVSIPTLEAVHAMMPKTDWEAIDDDWAEHDLASGAQRGDAYPGELNDRYGKVLNLADFVRKGQLANYEAFRAMYEGRFAKLFDPSSGVITWMSNPAQPSFVWQLYSYDLEPNAALFATRKACEPVHIMLNEQTGHVQIINNRGTPLAGAKASLTIYDLSGAPVYGKEWTADAPASRATDLGEVAWPATLSDVHFVQLHLHDKDGELLSYNFYWRNVAGHEDDLKNLAKLPTVKLETRVVRHDSGGNCLLDVTLTNPSSHVALMAHLQLRRLSTGERVLPVYYTDNYISLVAHESKTMTIEAAQADLKGEQPLITIDGWNVDVARTTTGGVTLALNRDALPSSWPETDLPIVRFAAFKAPLKEILINCGGSTAGDFAADVGYDGGAATATGNKVSVTAPSAAPMAVYQSERFGNMTYSVPMQPLPSGYTVRLHFAETKFTQAGKRKFNVEINGKSELSEFDIYAAAGGSNLAVTKDFPGITPDSEGMIRIGFRAGSADNPKIDGIEIVPAGH